MKQQLMGARTAKPVRVLIANHDSGIVQALREALPAHFECKVSKSGLLALEVIETWRPNVVIIDTRISDILYDALCSRMRCSTHMNGVPIIVLSHGGLLEKYRCINAGVDDYVQRPFTTQQLREHVLAALTSM